MQLIGYLGVIVSGVLLGLLGGGGAIIIVPIMVYAFGIPAVTATGYTFFVIAITSLVGFYRYRRQGLANVPAAVLFGLPSVVTVFVSRRLIVPALPDEFFHAGDFHFTKDMGIMMLFALLMSATAYNILFARRPVAAMQAAEYKKYGRLIMRGLLVGLLIGFVGGGGGFLIVSGLVLLLGMPVKPAVGTSMLIISLNSWVGFIGHITFAQSFDWLFVSLFTLLAMAGIVLGNLLSRAISESKLKTVFGWFLIAMAAWILAQEVYKGL